MGNDLKRLKELLLQTSQFVKKRNGWYRGTNCPYCGDKKRHFYIHIELDNDTPITWKCFKCGKGFIDKSVLECYGIDWKGGIPKGKISRRISSGEDAVKTYELNEGLYDVEYMNKCVDYISNRLGIDKFGMEELNKFGIVLNPNTYACIYLGGKVDDTGKIWFMCTNGMLIGRDMLKKKDAWEKYCGNVGSNDRMLYTIKNTFDMYKDINVCICEGVMDAIGLWFHGNIENGVFISVLGRDYMAGVKYMLDRGIFGDSVCIRIYKDADVKDVMIDKRLCSWFKSVDVYVNTIGKDFGLCADEIEIEKCII